MLFQIEDLIAANNRSDTQRSWADRKPTSVDHFIAQASTRSRDAKHVSFYACRTFDDALAYLNDIANDDSDYEPLGVINLDADASWAFTEIKFTVEPGQETDVGDHLF